MYIAMGGKLVSKLLYAVYFLFGYPLFMVPTFPLGTQFLFGYPLSFGYIDSQFIFL